MVIFHTGKATIDEELNVIEADEGLLAFLGVRRLANLANCIVAEDLDTVMAGVAAAKENGKAIFCCRMNSQDLGIDWVIAQARRTDKVSSQQKLYDFSIQDVAAFEDAPEIPRDVTTGLLTKEEIIRTAHRILLNPPEHGVYMCIIDIDNFAGVNENYGHLTGDLVLRTVGDIVSNCLEGRGTAGRIGGDEIMLILDGISDKEELRVVLKDIRVGIEEQFKDAPTAKGVTVSIGAVLCPDFAKNYDDSYTIADKMLFRAKDKGKNRYIIYTPEIHGDVLHTEEKEKKPVTEIKPLEETLSRKALIYELMDRFLAHRLWSVEFALVNVGNSYDLDGIIVYSQNLQESFCAYRRNPEKTPGDPGAWVPFSDVMSFGDDPEFHRLFNQDKLLVVDDVESLQSRHEELYLYLKKHGVRNAVIYRITQHDKKGFVILYNTREEKPDFTFSDVTDLGYISRMLEISIADR